MKQCSSCKTNKPLTEFGVDNRRKDKLYPYCKECKAHKNAEWVSENKEKHATSCATWYAKSKDRRYRTWTKHHYKKHYGISYEDFVAMLKSQQGLCLICKDTLVLAGPKANNKAVLDHNHTTGKIRGVLCSRCNWGLGKFRDSPELLKAAAFYLEKDYQNPIT